MRYEYMPLIDAYMAFQGHISVHVYVRVIMYTRVELQRSRQGEFSVQSRLVWSALVMEFLIFQHQRSLEEELYS